MTLIACASIVRITWYLCSQSSGLINAAAESISSIADTLLFELPIILLLTAGKHLPLHSMLVWSLTRY